MADEEIVAVIVDDHPAIVAGVERWCADADPPIRLIDAAHDPARTRAGPGRDADVVILDLQLGDKVMAFDQLEVLVSAGRQVIVYSMHDDSPTVMHCIDLGAFTYLTKAEGKGHLVPAVRAAARDLPYTSPALAGAMHADDRARLSDRERAALLAYFQSGRKRLAAQKLNVSVSTLDTYLARARIKYANIGRPANSPYALVRRALEDGLVTAEDLACE